MDLGFQQVGITDTDLSAEEPRLQAWLDKQYQGEMAWMARHGMMRARPHELLPGTLRVISVRMNYLPAKAAFASTLKNPQLGYVSRYALGRDYHKVLRNRLKKLGEMIQQHCGELNFRPFVDSAPLLERPLAAKAGLGWTGKHSLILNREAGSWFFLGELLIDIPLPLDAPQEEQCGRCVACMTICPTSAIVEPYVVDARRCISYLTIELEGAIPEEFRPLMGNRIYGCDDCLATCPWNKFASEAREARFHARAELLQPRLADLAKLTDAGFRTLFRGSPIKRIGRDRFIRNVLIAIGNSADRSLAAEAEGLLVDASPLVRAMAVWALSQLDAPRTGQIAQQHLPREDDPGVRAEWQAVISLSPAEAQ